MILGPLEAAEKGGQTSARSIELSVQTPEKSPKKKREVMFNMELKPYCSAPHLNVHKYSILKKIIFICVCGLDLISEPLLIRMRDVNDQCFNNRVIC